MPDSTLSWRTRKSLGHGTESFGGSTRRTIPAAPQLGAPLAGAPVDFLLERAAGRRLSVVNTEHHHVRLQIRQARAALVAECREAHERYVERVAQIAVAETERLLQHGRPE